MRAIESLPAKIRIHSKIQELDAKYKKEKEEDSKFSEDSLEMKNYKELKEWLTKEGAYIGPIKLRYYNENQRKVYSIRGIKEKECLLHIPKKLILTPEIAKQELINNKIIKDNELYGLENSYVAIFLLLEEQKPESFWRPYINIFPRDTSQFPIFYSRSEHRLLEGSQCFCKIVKWQTEFVLEYERIIRVIPEIAKHGSGRFSHYRMIVLSKHFGITIDNVKTNALVPLADMFNFNVKPQISWKYKNESEGFVAKANQFIHCGAELYEDYGCKSNLRYLMCYGFVLEDNENDEVELVIGLNESDHNYQDKLRDVEPFRGLKLYFDRSKRYYQWKLIILLNYMRLKVYDKILKETQKFRLSFLPHEEEKGIEAIDLGNPISITNECAALLKLLEVIEVREAEYPTTLKQDVKRLSTDESLTHNQKNCMKLLIGEKKVLQYLTEFANLALDVIKIFNREKKAIFKANTGNELYEVYAKNVLTPFLEELVKKSAESQPKTSNP